MKHNRRIQPMMFLAAAAAVMTVAGGCASSEPPSWHDRARSDPYNFKPESDWPDVSGGGVGHFDKKAFKQDLNHVFNP